MISVTSDFVEICTERGFSIFSFNFLNFIKTLQLLVRAKHRRMILPYSEILVISLKTLSTKADKIGTVIGLLPSL